MQLHHLYSFASVLGIAIDDLYPKQTVTPENAESLASPQEKFLGAGPPLVFLYRTTTSAAPAFVLFERGLAVIYQDVVPRGAARLMGGA